MNAKLTDASTQVDAAQAELIPLTAQGYPEIKLPLPTPEQKYKLQSRFKASYQDVVQSDKY